MAGETSETMTAAMTKEEEELGGIASVDDGDSKRIIADEDLDADTTGSLSQPSERRVSHGPSSTTPESFSWDVYLRENNAVPAPSECFYQNPIPPVNLFQVDRKLESPDPRGSSVLCLATIVYVHSVWVCVRLDGEDDSNDQWVICDDSAIHPVGYSKEIGSSVSPPMGYMHNLASFHKFVESQLKPDDAGNSPACPEHWFQPLSVEFHPRTNRFRVGQKCEAIDLKSFSGRPCPATIVNVDGDHVTISYDGWNHAYNSIQRYDSRSIFPVGWSARVGLELQPPRKPKGSNSHIS